MLLASNCAGIDVGAAKSIVCRDVQFPRFWLSILLFVTWFIGCQWHQIVGTWWSLSLTYGKISGSTLLLLFLYYQSLLHLLYSRMGWYENCHKNTSEICFTLFKSKGNGQQKLDPVTDSSVVTTFRAKLIFFSPNDPKSRDQRWRGHGVKKFVVHFPFFWK
jgi:hypothetical protein